MIATMCLLPHKSWSGKLTCPKVRVSVKSFKNSSVELSLIFFSDEMTD